MLGNFACFYQKVDLSADFLKKKINLKKNPKNIRVLCSLDPNQAHNSMGSDRGSNCLVTAGEWGTN